MPMKQAAEAEAWVVYRMTLAKHPDGINAVCEQAEWDAMEQADPGKHTLIRSGITSEAEAERLARGTSGDAKVTLHTRRS
jgi:hypothetical protein